VKRSDWKTKKPSALPVCDPTDPFVIEDRIEEAMALTEIALAARAWREFDAAMLEGLCGPIRKAPRAIMAPTPAPIKAAEPPRPSTYRERRAAIADRAKEIFASWSTGPIRGVQSK
jgi:hypothetical protein